MLQPTVAYHTCLSCVSTNHVPTNIMNRCSTTMPQTICVICVPTNMRPMDRGLATRWHTAMTALRGHLQTTVGASLLCAAHSFAVQLKPHMCYQLSGHHTTARQHICYAARPVPSRRSAGARLMLCAASAVYVLELPAGRVHAHAN